MVSSHVARIWYEGREHETKSKIFKGDTQKYYQIHAMNSGKAIGLCFLLDGQSTVLSLEI